MKALTVVKDQTIKERLSVIRPMSRTLQRSLLVLELLGNEWTKDPDSIDLDALSDSDFEEGKPNSRIIAFS